MAAPTQAPGVQPQIGPSPADEEYWRQQMVAMLGGGEGAPMMGMELAPQDVHGTADTLGSPIGSGQLGNGPGVGLSGAGAQLNIGRSEVAATPSATPLAASRIVWRGVAGSPRQTGALADMKRLALPRGR